MTSLIVYSIDAAQRLSAQEVGGRAWLYLGKNLVRREGFVSRFGEKGLLPLGERLHELAGKLWQPFLDFIADLGTRQTDRLGWWSSSCSWRDAGASDLFLLICYEHLIEQLSRERQGISPPLFLVVEDPWLFRQVREAFAGRPEVHFQGQAPLWFIRVKAFLLGAASRAVWTVRLAGNYLGQKWFWRRRNQPQSSEPLIAIYSYPQTRCLSGFDGWIDPYLGGLDILLGKAGYAVCRFSPPEVRGFAEALGRRSNYFRPLILFATVLSLLRVVFVSWRPVWPKDSEIGGRSIRWLLLREWWLDRWRSSYPLFRLFFECMSRLIESERVSLVIYPYENQPWEKMLVLAARSHGVPTLGYQHGGILALPHFYGSGEAEFAPLPDVIITSGPHSHEMLAKGGTPRERLMMGGCLRYQYLQKYGNAEPELPIANPIRVLVAFPIESVLVRHFIQALRLAFPDGGRTEGVTFFVKPHPMCPVTKEELGWPATIVHGSFEEAIRPCSVVIYTGTSTGIEALAMGRRVIRYRPELLLDLDQGGFLTQDELVDCGDWDLRTKLLSVVQALDEKSPHRSQWDGKFDRVYAPVNDAAWLEVIDRLCRKTPSRREPANGRVGSER